MTDVLKVRETVVANVRHVEVVTRGTQGPPGVVPTYTHTQVSASTTWTINHNLGFKPDVYLYDAGGNEFDAQVAHPNNNQTVVTLTQATAGTARLH